MCSILCGVGGYHTTLVCLTNIRVVRSRSIKNKGVDSSQMFPSPSSSQLLLNRSTRRQTATIPPTANYAQNAAATLSIPSGSNPLSSFYPTAALRTLTLNAIGQRSRCVFGSVSQNPSEASDDILTFSVNSFCPFHVYRARLKGFGQVW